MAKPITINRDTPPQKSMDYYFLKKEGIRLAQQYSGAVWTDYNDHDPGVTLLEYLCYAITDLGYRTNFKIEDLLYAKTAGNTAAASNAFFSPAAILPCAPLSTLDYRRLLIDHFDAIKNVWIGPAKDSLYEGLFDIKLQLNDEFNSQAPQQAIITDVIDFMAANRNLTEDINAVTILQTESLDIKGEIALELDASEELVLAQMLHEVESFLNPKVKYHTQQELSLKGYDYCTIFDGPKPEYGFILPEFLPPLTTAIYISEIRELLLKIPGVQAIHFLDIRLNNRSNNRDEIAVPPDTIIVLNPNLKTTDTYTTAKKYPIQFYKGDFQVMTNLDRTIQMYQAIAMTEHQLFQMKVNLDDIVPLSRKRLEDIGVYYSFQRYLPHVYGLGEFGVPQNADSLRKAQAKQLKGYLLIFEQFLSSYLAQLTHVRDLFSIGITEAEERIKEAEQEDVVITKKQEESSQQSYFVQFPSDVPDLDPLIRVSGDGDKLDLVQAELTALVKEFDHAEDRKNRFLDHLLARFGESFQSDFLQKIHEFEETEDITETLIAAKTSFLQDYIKLSKYRGRGFNYRKESWESSDNVSGFKKRICALMNIEKAQDRSLLPHKHWNLSELKIKRGSKLEKRFALPFLPMLSHGIDEGNYQIKYNSEESLYQLLFSVPASENKQQLVFESEKKKACQNLKVKLIDQLKTINKEGKGFFLLEHVLLRPLKPKGWKLRFHIQGDHEDEKLDIAFESFRYDTLESMKSISDSLLLIASNPSNFDFLQANEKWFILIKANEKPILITKANFKTETAAKTEIKRIVALIKQKKDGNEMENWETFNNWIDFKPEPGQGFQLSSDFYSHRISIIIPKWIKSFQQQDIRSFFEGLVGEQLPAHILVDFHWMNIHQLTTFETVYEDWLTVKSNATSDKRELDDLSIKLSEILAVEEEHKKLISTLIAKKTADQLPVAIENALFNKYQYSVYFREDDLQIIEGIGEVIERTLKESGINSWAKIVVRGETIIGKNLRQHLGDKTYQIHKAKIKSWITQADLATKANWDELIKLQKKLNSPPGKGKKGTSPAKIQVLALARRKSGILIV